MADTWRILVVEEHPDGQEVVGTILAHLNMEADVAGNVSEADGFLFGAAQQYHAAIIDLALPDKDGWDLLGQICNNPAT
jgi:DNA-binding response OmpR family regulator